MPRKRTKPERIEVYAILWTDAILNNDGEEPQEPIPALTFGVIREATENHVKVAGELFADEDTRLVTSIGAGMGVRVIRLGSLPLPKEFRAWRKRNAT